MTPLSRWFVSLCVCLGLVLPGVGRAAQTPGEASELAGTEAREVPGTQEDAPRRLLAEEGQEDAPRVTERRGAPRGLRILGEVGGGLVTSAALGLAGGLVGGLLCAASGGVDDFDSLLCLIPLGIGVVGGVVLGFPLGVWWAGETLGGDGLLLAALGGGLGGVVAGVAVLAVASVFVPPSPNNPPAVASFTVPVLGMAGCIVGYELFQRSPSQRVAGGGLSPLVAVTGQGAVFGLSGRF